MSSSAIKWKWMALLAVPAAFLFVAGCDEGDDPVDEGASGSAAIGDEADVAGDAETGKLRKDRRGHRGGKIGHHGRKDHHKGSHSPSSKLLKYALKTLDLTVEQQAALESLRDSKKDRKGRGDRGDHADFHAALVKALETGELDRAAFDAAAAAKNERFEQKQRERNEKLATLHATLTPEQRKTLVDTVRAKQEQDASKRSHKGDDRRKGRGGKRDHRGKGKLQHMLKGIELTAEQQAQIDALKAKGEAQRPTAEDRAEKKEEKLAEMNALLDAFVADDFDPAASAPEPLPLKDPLDKYGFQVEQFEALLGILTAEQRAQLAEKIKSHPGKMERHGKGVKGCACGGECEGDCPVDCPEKRKAGCPRARQAGDCPFADGE